MLSAMRYFAFNRSFVFKLRITNEENLYYYDSEIVFILQLLMFLVANKYRKHYRKIRSTPHLGSPFIIRYIKLSVLLYKLPVKT